MPPEADTTAPTVKRSIINTEKLTIALPIYHALAVLGFVVSVVIAWNAMAAHKDSEGHPATKERIGKVEEAIISLNAWRQTHDQVQAVQAAHNKEAMQKLNETVQQVIVMQSTILAAQPPASARRPSVQARQRQIEANVKRGAAPLDGL